jgi:membrane protease YdiL (CAAX protease family)
MSNITCLSPASNRIVGFIRRNPLISMYLLMFTLAWSVMVPQALHSQGIISPPLPGFLDILTGWSPGIAALFVSGVMAGRDGIRKLIGRFLIWRVGLRWYLLSVLLLAAIILGGIGLHVFFGGTMPVIPAAEASLMELILILAVYILLGSLINTEEIAWRGFALPRLQYRFGAFTAALLIAIPEVTLHLPLFWVKENGFFQTIGIPWFSAFSVAAVFIYIFIFNRTNGSLLVVTILHASQNAWANLLSDNSTAPFYFSVGLTWVIALALIVATRGRMGWRQAGSDQIMSLEVVRRG